ncbi:Unknown protein sequence [Pseudomonas syringae pv. aceris]|nr:Unknown protein sequence [Pseudomonas syringae pv. aceris]
MPLAYRDFAASEALDIEPEASRIIEAIRPAICPRGTKF